MPSSIESFQETMTSTDKVPETDKLVISIGECLENIKLFQGSSVSSQKQRNDSILLTRNLMKRWKSFFFFLVVLGFELKILLLLCRCSINTVMPSALFAFNYFSDRVPYFSFVGPRTVGLISSDLGSLSESHPARIIVACTTFNLFVEMDAH
jgi:hypothetical protein